MSRATLLATLLLGLLGAPAAWAQSCSLTAVSGVSFGTYDVFSATPLDSTGTITYTCSGVTLLTQASIDLSTGGSTSYSPRRLSRGSSSLTYNLYRDAARSQVWGNGTSGTARYGPVQATNNTVSLTVYGRLDAGQRSAPAGAYADTVVITLTF